MSQGPVGAIRRTVHEAVHISFKHITVIKGDGFDLNLNSKFLFSDHDIPGYEFDILVGEESAGTFTVLIEKNFTNIATLGNVGIAIKPKFFGQQLPSKVALASLSLFKAHGVDKILITFDKDNDAIEKACEELSAEYLDTLTAAGKKRYVLETGHHTPS